MKQLYHLLCPVDFSAASYEAIEKAGFLAQLFQADLTLLHVVKVPVSFGVDYGMDAQSEVLTQKAARHARLLLREAKRAYIPYAVKCKSSIRFGQPAREILREVKQLKADLLIWGMESGGEGDELFAHLCEDLHIPLVSFCSQDKLRLSGLRRLLVPMQLSEQGSMHSRYLHNFFLHHLSVLTPELTLLDVVDAGLKAEEYEARQERIESLAASLLPLGLKKARGLALRDDDSPQRMLQLARRLHLDLLLLPFAHQAEEEEIVPGPVHAQPDPVEIPVVLQEAGPVAEPVA